MTPHSALCSRKQCQTSYRKYCPIHGAIAPSLRQRPESSKDRGMIQSCWEPDFRTPACARVTTSAHDVAIEASIMEAHGDRTVSEKMPGNC